eukprot:13105617-Ditylum_brightwellii.AAC.1
MRVGFLLAGITSNDAGLEAAMANIKSSADLASETSKRHHFELVTNFLQPFCPVLKQFPYMAPSVMPSRSLMCQDLVLGLSQVPVKQA